MKKIFLLLSITALIFSFRSSEARQGFAVGLGPIGNIYLIDTTPIMNPGIGGHFSFNYRFQEQLAFETTFFMTSQSGTNISTGDNGILFLGMPTFDLKYYLLKNDPHLDPYVAIGVGVYWLTEGNISNSTGGFGLGTQLGVGFDYYFSDQISAGFEGVFRSIGLIRNVSTPSASTAIFPYSLLANIAFHF